MMLTTYQCTQDADNLRKEIEVCVKLLMLLAVTNGMLWKGSDHKQQQPLLVQVSGCTNIMLGSGALSLHPA